MSSKRFIYIRERYDTISNDFVKKFVDLIIMKFEDFEMILTAYNSDYFLTKNIQAVLK